MEMRAAYYLAASRALVSLHQVPANPGTLLNSALQPPSSSRNTEAQKMPASSAQSNTITGSNGSGRGSSDSTCCVHGTDSKTQQCPGCTPQTGGKLTPPSQLNSPKVGYFARQLRRLLAVSDVQAKDAAPVPNVKNLAVHLQQALASTDVEFPSCLVHGIFFFANKSLQELSVFVALHRYTPYIRVCSY